MKKPKEICSNNEDSLPALATYYTNYSQTTQENNDDHSDCEEFRGFETTKVVNAARDKHLLNRRSFVEDISKKQTDSGNDSDGEDCIGFHSTKILNAGRDKHLLNRRSLVNDSESDISEIQEVDCFDREDVNPDSGYGSQTTNDQSQLSQNKTTEVNEALQRIQVGESCLKKTNVQEWHERLRPFLAHARERHHFDVFEIGTEIIDSLKPERTNTDTYTFQDVMEGKEESYVSRYFLSSLLLINQGNIDLTVKNKSSEQPAEWSDLEFKLISTKRHTVSIEDNIGLHHRETTENDPLEKEKRLPTRKSRGPLNSTMREGVLESEIDEINVSALRMKRLSTETQHSAYEHVTVDVDSIRPLSPVHKKQKSDEDHDSGIFSTSDRSTI